MDYRQALVEVGKELSGTIKIEDVTNTVLKAMEGVIRSEKTIIFLKRSSGADFTPAASYGAGEIKVAIPPEHVLIRHLKHTEGALVKDELALQREQEADRRHAEEIKEAENVFDWLDVTAVAPLEFRLDKVRLCI